MSKFQIRMLAIALWLIAPVLVIPPLAINDEAQRAGKATSPLLYLMFAGVPIVIWIGVVLWRAPARAARRRAARTGPLDAVVDAVRFTRNVSIGLVPFFIGSAVFLGIIPLFDNSAGTGGNVFIEILAVLSLGLAVWCAIRARRLWDPRKNPVLELIEQNPKELASFEVHEVRAQLGQRGYSLHLQKIDGKKLSVNLIAEDIDAVTAAIRRQAPHARHA